ncbi:hypothetical protein BD414DRAFT_479086 [Trametes punicea]|nr:hypothetical protein BD414DRAFT_479086 [Trametes punicea]
MTRHLTDVRTLTFSLTQGWRSRKDFPCAGSGIPGQFIRIKFGLRISSTGVSAYRASSFFPPVQVAPVSMVNLRLPDFRECCTSIVQSSANLTSLIVQCIDGITHGRYALPGTNGM